MTPPAAPLVSLVLPTHARPQFLGAAVRSICAQSMADWELLVMDTGAPDAALKPGDLPTDSRLRYMACPGDNQAEALNRGAAAARGRWLAFQDDDDISHPRRLEICLRRAKRMRADIVQPAHAVLQPGERLDFSPPNRLSKLVLIKRARFMELGGFRAFFRVHEDLDFWLRAQEQGWRIAQAPQILYFYRNHLSPRISEQVPHYGGAYALAAEWSAWCRQHARTDPVEEGASLMQMMCDLRAMPQPARDDMLDYYLVNSAKFGMKRMVWRGEPQFVRAALADLAELLQTCGYGRSIARRMADLRASLWMLRMKQRLGWQRARGGLGLPAYLKASERNPDMLKPAGAAALAARRQRRKRRKQLAQRPVFRRIDALASSRMWTDFAAHLEGIKKSTKRLRHRQKHSLRVDFYNVKYGILGSQTAHERAGGKRRNPPRGGTVVDADNDMAHWHRKMLPFISPSSEDPEVIFYCPLTPADQRHFHHLRRKIFLPRDNILPDWRYADWGVSFDAPSDRNFYANWHDGHPRPAQVLEVAAPPAAPADSLAKKTKFCAFVYFEKHCASRIHLLELLSRTMRVEAGGRMLRSVRHALMPRPVANYPEGVADFYRPYKFAICFENVRVAGYHSEKIWSAFRGDAVPIYLGDPHIATQYNPEAFIHARDFDSLESLAAHVMRVHHDDALYLRYLSQPRLTEAQEARVRGSDARYLEFLCRALLTPPVGAYAPRAQSDAFLRESISRLEREVSAHLLGAPHLDFRPTWGSTLNQMNRVWQGETP